MRISVVLGGAALSVGLVATPAFAAETAVAANATALPVQLGPNARTQYRAIFDDIDAARWIEATAKLDVMPEGPLHSVARAAIYTGKGSPKVDGAQLAALATIAPQLPEAPTLIRLASARGITLSWFLKQGSRSCCEPNAFKQHAMELTGLSTGAMRLN